MEITDEIKIKVFSQYLGCKFKISISEQEFILNGNSLELIREKSEWNDAKLILKPESKSMAFSEEDYKSFKKIESITEELLKEAVGKDDFVSKLIVSGFLSYQYAISKGIDFPQYLLEGKTLFECGLAIYEN